jgi:tetratricopeptide (TPR) repeat protein
MSIRPLGTFVLAAAVPMAAAATATAAEAPSGRRLEWTTKSAEARTLLVELQNRIENFQGGARNLELGQKIVAADPAFALGAYYLSVVTPNPDEGLRIYDKSRELGKKASDGERRFIEGMVHVRVNQGVDFRRSIEPLAALARDYPGDRLVHMILGQLYNGDGQWQNARAAFERALAIGPRSARAEAFLASDALLKERYAEARAAYEAIEKSLPKGSAPFAIRFGVTFSHLYEGNVDAALRSLETYLAEYKAGGLDQQFPEVFIWNAMGRINLENGRLPAALEAYEKGYASVPRSPLPEDQKQTWLGRLRHGKCRTLARMGRHQEAWAEAEAVKTMIVEGGEAGRQYWPAYHYLAGYAKLEAGAAQEAVEHLLQADPKDPFHTLLLARAYEKLGRTADAKKSYQRIVASEWPGIERPLAYPEAKRKSQTL